MENPDRFLYGIDTKYLPRIFPTPVPHGQPSRPLPSAERPQDPSFRNTNSLERRNAALAAAVSAKDSISFE